MKDHTRLPLKTQGRFIVDRLNERVKFACVNWYGMEAKTFAPGGLEKQPMDYIARRIYDLGFNCVRLPYSLEAHVHNPLVKDEFLAGNPGLRGLRFLDIMDKTIESLTKLNIMVFIDNHLSEAGWCCHWSQPEGLWYVPGYPEEVWLDSLKNMTRRYKPNPLVVGFDVRNEVHDYDGTMLTWGDGNPKTDWAAAATRAGNVVLKENPDMLIFVMSLCFGMDLRGAQSHPLKLEVPNKVVYQTHNYIEYQFWNLIPYDVAPWETIRSVCSWVIFLFVLLLVRMLLPWWRSGRPMPAASLAIISLGLWVSFFALLLSAGAYKAFIAGCIYCRIGVEIDILPMFYFMVSVAVVAGLAALGGYFYGRRHGFGGSLGRPTSSDVSDEMLLNDESCDESVNEDEEEPEYGGVREMDLEKSLQARCPRNVRQWLGLVKPPASAMGKWHRGFTIKLQGTILCTILLTILLVVRQATYTLGSYEFLEKWLDSHWGFVTEEGREYTAPLIMGEFGYLNHGIYWQMFTRYIAERDYDFAYWAINGQKYSEGWIDPITGLWNEFDEPLWFNETFGILESDYSTVSAAWRVRDLQAMMESPARWSSTDIGCPREYLDFDCNTGDRKSVV